MSCSWGLSIPEGASTLEGAPVANGDGRLRQVRGAPSTGSEGGNIIAETPPSAASTAQQRLTDAAAPAPSPPTCSRCGGMPNPAQSASASAPPSAPSWRHSSFTRPCTALMASPDSAPAWQGRPRGLEAEVSANVAAAQAPSAREGACKPVAGRQLLHAAWGNPLHGAWGRDCAGAA